MDNAEKGKFHCADGVVRTMEEIEELTERGIAVSIVKKKYVWGGFRHPPKMVFPPRFTGGGWTE